MEISNSYLIFEKDDVNKNLFLFEFDKINPLCIDDSIQPYKGTIIQKSFGICLVDESGIVIHKNSIDLSKTYYSITLNSCIDFYHRYMHKLYKDLIALYSKKLDSSKLGYISHAKRP